MQAVMEHPSFKADPLAAISHHLQATLPAPAAPPAARSKGGPKQRPRRKHMQLDG
jgi:hypothetical protein